jgi:hypothetical protein
MGIEMALAEKRTRSRSYAGTEGSERTGTQLTTKNLRVIVWYLCEGPGLTGAFFAAAL